MARQEIVQFVDDLDGSDAIGTIEFGIDGKLHEIDLSEANRDKLLDVLAPFIDAARKAQSMPKRTTKGVAQKTSTEVQDARAWLQANGYPVKDKGRIHADLMDVWRQNKDLPQVEEAPEPEDETPEVTAVVEDREPTDEEVNAWWANKGYKPGASIALRRAQYKRAHDKAS